MKIELKEITVRECKRLRAGRGGVGKIVVLGMLERGDKMRASTINSTSSIDFQCAIVENVKGGSSIYADCHRSYQHMKGYEHEIVKHSVGEYVRIKAHTNGTKSFWALLKRGYYGISHHISSKYISRYIDEFAVRHNLGHDTWNFLSHTINGMFGKRLTYVQLKEEA